MRIETAQDFLAKWQQCKAAFLLSGDCEMDGAHYNDLTLIEKKIEQFEKLVIALQHVAAWEQADLNLATAEIYSFMAPSGSRTVHRSDSEGVMRQLRYWKQKAGELDPTTRSNPLSSMLGREMEISQ